MRFLRLPEVLHKTGLARATVYRLMDQGRFPQSIPLTDETTGARPIGWLEDELDDWIRARVAAARSGEVEAA